VSEAYIQEYVDHDGHRLGLHHYPDPGPHAPVVVIWPAMGTPARFYRPLAQRLGRAGIAVITTDLRGQGASTPKPTRSDRYGYHHLADDVGAVLDALAPRLDGRPYYLLGHSLGGQVCSIALATGMAKGAAGLILVAVGLPWYRSYRGVKSPAMYAASQGIVAITALAGLWPGWAFGGRQARRVMLDWGYIARHGSFPRRLPADHHGRARRHGEPVDLGAVGTPVLAISVAGDQFTPRETLDHLCGQLTAAPIERVHITQPNLDHFSWVREADTVADHLVPFVTRPGP
jgi:predicted alpha/beta hydrolase